MIKDVLLSLAKGFALPFSPKFWKKFFSGLKEIWRAICTILRRLLHCEWHRPRKPERTGCCIDLPPDVLKRADPLIYSQYYMMKQGLAVSWDNPDIEIFDGTVLVTGPLKPKHHYRVRVRVWNGSYDAPAVGVGVELSYLSFGAQTVSHPIATGSVALGAKGTIDHPAFTELDWETPDTGGHYCLQARLIWFDDANPDNNLGQKNVNVAEVQSPAHFSFVVRNGASVPARFLLEADAYTLPELPVCRQETRRPVTRLQESKARWEQARKDHGYGQFPVPENWTVTMTPQAFGLDPRQEQTVQVDIQPKDPSFHGAKTFNVHVFRLYEREERRLAGGVTLTATKK